MTYSVPGGLVLVIPDWFPLALSLFALWLASTNLWVRGQAGRGGTKLAEKCAEAADGYARSDEVIAGGFEQRDRPDLAADARARAVQHREMAQLLRDCNRRRGWKGLLRARGAAAERPAPPGRSEAADEALSASEAVSAPTTDPRR